MPDEYSVIASFAAFTSQDQKEQLAPFSEADVQNDMGRRVMRDIANATGLKMSQRNESKTCVCLLRRQSVAGTRRQNRM